MIKVMSTKNLWEIFRNRLKKLGKQLIKQIQIQHLMWTLLLIKILLNLVTKMKQLKKALIEKDQIQSS